MSNDLPTAKQPPLRSGDDLDLVPKLPQTLHRLLRHALLHAHRPVKVGVPLGQASDDTHARRIERLLRREARDQLAEENLHVALRLHEPAHDAESAVQRPVGRVGHHAGDDGVVGTLPGLQFVGVVRVEAEVGAAVLQREAAALGDDAGAKTAIVAVDEGRGVAVLVRDGEVDGVAALEGRGDVLGGFANVELLHGLCRIEELCAGGRVLARDEAGRGHGDDVGVGDVPARVGEAEAEGLDDGVEVGRRVVVLCGPGGDDARVLELLDYAEGHEGDDALAVGRVLPDFDGAVAAAGGGGGG